MNLSVAPVIPSAPLIVLCRRRGCTLPSWLYWCLHWPGVLVFGAGILLLLAASWWWAYRW